MSEACERAVEKGFEYWDACSENTPVVRELVTIGWDAAKADLMGHALELSEWIFKHYPTPESDTARAALYPAPWIEELYKDDSPWPYAIRLHAGPKPEETS